MRRLLLAATLLSYFSSLSYSQTTLFSENWNTGGPGWTLNVPTGTEGADANFFTISAAEGGNITPNLGAPASCGVANNGDNTLHVTSMFFPTGGAAYDAGGLCGILFCPQADRRCESPTINCTGYSNISVDFNYIENGQTTLDDAKLYYFDGVTWTMIDNMPKTLTGCGGQGLWTSRTVLLPASANGNPNVKIAWHWMNNDDGVGTDPSFAVDNITVTAPSAGAPTAAFTASATSVCIGAPVNFTDNSTGGPTTWAWTFPSGTPANAATQNVTGVVWNTPGTYSVTLTASNVSGNSTATVVITVNPLPTVTASGNPTNICVGQQTTLTGSGATSYVWNPGAIPGSPVNVSPGATTTYTVTGTDANGCTNTSSVTITVTPCSVPIVNFIASDTVICVGDCISFTDQSTNSPTTWSWTFSGAATATSALQNPTNICYNSPGVFAVTLIATNTFGSGSYTKTGYINVNPPPAAFAGADVTICTGQQTTLNGSGGTAYLWMPGNLTTPSVIVTPATTTTYTLTVTDASGCTAQDMITVTVQPCTVPVSLFSASQTGFCAGTCIGFTDNSTGTPTGWNWQFPGATPSSSTSQNPTNICFNTAGTYTIVLIVNNAFGTDTSFSTVTVGSPPTADAGAAVSIAIGNQTTLTATGGTGTYSWSPSNGLGSPNSASTTASPTVTTTYTVTFTDANGCSDSDTVTVQVIEAYGIFIPSAFSPNDDGANDMLFCYGAGIKSMEFVVFDRFGEKVFESKSVNDGWDGTFRGKPMSSGIYAYYCTAEFFDGSSKQLKGDVSLVR